MKEFFKNIESKLLAGELISYQEALDLSYNDTLDQEVLELANKLCRSNSGNHVSLCTIINAKSGKCTENCKYCAQSSHYETGINTYPLMKTEQILELAIQNQKEGVHRFSIVSSGNSVSPSDFDTILNTIIELKKHTKLELCASIGKISFEQACMLKNAGISMYHHNIETCREFYSNICTTHTYKDRISTIMNVQKAGLKICCGGIIGMGETLTQRIKMAFELRELGVKCIPINILNPIKGTPLQNAQKLSSNEIIKTLSLFRLIIPYASIRYAGGRSALSVEEQKKGLLSGIDGMLVGNYLTTIGNKISEDLKILYELGLKI